MAFSNEYRQRILIYPRKLGTGFAYIHNVTDKKNKVMKTWICAIYGGGAPIYLVSAENEKRAWQLIKREVNIKYDGRVYLTEKDCTGLCEVPEWTINHEQISDLSELYAHHGILKKGSFEGFR